MAPSGAKNGKLLFSFIGGGGGGGWPLNAHSVSVAIEMVCPNFHYIVLLGCAFLLVGGGGQNFVLLE